MTALAIDKLHVKISLKGLLSRVGCKGTILLKTSSVLNAMSARFGYRMRPHDWNSIRVPTRRQVDARTNGNHPELKKDEIFLANHNVLISRDIPKDLSGLSTIRMGEKAYDANGYAIDQRYMRPLIINALEYNKFNSIVQNRK